MMKAERRENVLTGLIGAFLGSLIGVACIVAIGQLGYVASISGVIMAVCAIKGYELMGGAMSRKGAVIACILIVVMTYLGNRLDFTVTVARLVGTDIFSTFQALNELFDAGYLNAGAYWGNLVMLYLFTLLGAVPTLITAFRRATPVSIPPASAGNAGEQPAAATEAPTKIYPFAGLSWTRAVRLSIALPMLLVAAVMVAVLFFYMNDQSIPMILTMLGCLIGMLISGVWMLVRLAAVQGMKYVFVRTDGELWRVDLAKLNRIEPYRFSTKIGAVRDLRWDILTEEEQQRARSAIERAIRSIRAGEIMPGSILYQLVLYLPDPRVEKETKWVWKISYALNSGTDGCRKTMMIGKSYLDFAPTPDTTAPEGPLPVQWSALVISLALTVLLAVAGYGIGLAFSGGTAGGGTAGSPNDIDLSEVRPESVVFYEQNGVRFQVDSSFQIDDEIGQLTDPDTGTVYMVGVTWGCDSETALDILLGAISEFRTDDTFERFSFAYPSAEEDLIELPAEDGTLYQHNLLTIYFSGGQMLHNAVSLSDDGLFIQVMALQNGQDSEEHVKGVIRYLLTTLTASGTAGGGETAL